MANATVLPTYTQNKFFKWSTTLTSSLSTSETAIAWSEAPRDENGAIITGAFLITVKNTRSNPNRSEMMWVPASAVAADGLSATGVVRRVKLSGIDYTASDSDSSHSYEFKAGDEVFCSIAPQDGELLRAAVQGLIGTGGTQMELGDGASGYKTYGIYTNSGFIGVLRGNGVTTQYSNDGSTWISIASVSASNLVQASSADTTPSYLNDKIDVATSGRLVKSITSPAGNEKVALTLATTLTDAEMNQLHGISANVTAVNANTLTDGSSSNADALHTHLNLGNYSFTAYENIAQYDAVALLGIEVEYFSQLTDANLALGDSNVRRKYAVKVIPSVTSSSLTTMQFRAAEAVNGATALGNLTISIQSDSAGAPSGTAITNGTANVISQATQRTWTNAMGTRTATWAASPTLTAGTTYWIVWECAATDGTNYLNLSVNSSHDEDYLTFTRLTYNLDTTSWGTSTTNATPFFWFNAQVKLLGMAIVPTDANWGGRTWSFIGFAQTAITAQNAGVISTDYAILTGLTPNSPYYLSTTAGQITTIPPAGVYASNTPPSSFTYKIGRALYSTTTLKVQYGTKRIMISEDGLSATTTRQYITWFPVEFLRVSATGTGSNDSAVSQGYVLADGTDGCVNMNYVNAAAGTAVYDNTNSLYTRGDNTDKFTGAASNFTNAGFQYTYTRGGTGVMYATIEVIG